jgi:hypothetical protein
MTLGLTGIQSRWTPHTIDSRYFGTFSYNVVPHLCTSISLEEVLLILNMPTSKSLILTGASRGIGLAIAKYLLKDSHKLFLVSRTAGPLEELKSEYPGQVEFVAADLADFSVGSAPISQKQELSIGLFVTWAKLRSALEQLILKKLSNLPQSVESGGFVSRIYRSQIFISIKGHT